jgi:hypothetical protein
VIVKKEDLRTGMIVLSDVELYKGFTKNSCLTVTQPFLILDIVTGVGFSRNGIKITYLSSKGKIEKYTMTLNYNFVVL